MQIAIENIIVPEGRRPLDQAKVEQIAESFELVGQIAPIGLRRLGNVTAKTSFERIKKLELVFGGHRLEAAKKLGWKKIDAVEISQVVLVPKGCVETYGDYTKLVEITENLHRADLTTQQRNEQLALWVELYNRNRIRTPEQPNSKPGPKPNPGVVAAAKMTGRTPKGVKEAIKTTKVSPEVKEAADRAELSQRQRLAISRLPEAEQLDAVSRQAEINAKAGEKVSARSSDIPKFISQFTRTDGQVKAACDYNPEDPGDVAESDTDTPEIIRHRIFMYRATEALRLARECGLEKASAQEITDDIFEGALKAAEAWSELTSKLKPDMAPADRVEQQTTLAHSEPAKLTPNIDASRAAYLADVEALDLTFEQKAMEIHKIMEATGLWLRHGTFRPRMVS